MRRARAFLTAAVTACLALAGSSALLLAASPVPGASVAPTAEAAIVLDSGVVRLTADAVSIQAGGRIFEVTQGAGSPTIMVTSDPGDAHYRTLELEWRDQGVPMRIYMYFAADEDTWWVSEIRTYDGSSDGEWIHYQGPLFEAPLGLGWAGDFDQASGPGGRNVPGRLTIQGMRLNGFDPATIPADVQNCRPLSEVGGIEASQIEPMAPAQAHAILRARGICHTFRYEAAGYSERWCVAPPGRITEVLTGTEGLLIIFVTDVVPAVHTPRPQPPLGWGC